LKATKEQTQKMAISKSWTALVVLFAVAPSIAVHYDEFRAIEEFSALMEQQNDGEDSQRAVSLRGLQTDDDDAECSDTDRIVSQIGNSRLTMSKCGVLERKRCKPPSSISSATMNDSRTNPKCKAGTCGGCCRDFSSYLACDETGQQHTWIPCVCNSKTYVEVVVSV
jgi:hypothetical protein